MFSADRVDVSGDRATALVSATYAIAGVRGTFEVERRMRARRTADGWRVVAAAGRRGLPPWEVDDFRERRTEHFVVLAPPEVPVDELVVALEDGYATMSELLTQRAASAALPRRGGRRAGAGPRPDGARSAASRRSPPSRTRA